MPAVYVRAAFRAIEVTSQALIVNVIHYELDAFTSPADLQAAAEDIYTHLGTEYLNVLHSGAVLQDLTVTTETYPGAVPAQGQHSALVAGNRTVPDHGLSAGLCALVAYRTATPKRYARGRSFMPPGMSTTQTAGEGAWSVSGSYLTACTAFAAKYLAGFGVGNNSYAPIVFSRTRAKQALTPFIFPVTAAAPKTTQHFLRSRTTSP